MNLGTSTFPIYHNHFKSSTHHRSTILNAEHTVARQTGNLEGERRNKQRINITFGRIASLAAGHYVGARCLRLYKNFQAYNYHSFSFESFGFDLRLTRRTTKAIQEPGDVIYVMNLTNIKPDTLADEYSKSQQFILRGRR